MKTKVTIVFKNGHKAEYFAENCKVTRNNLTGDLLGCEFSGIYNKEPLYIDFREVLLIEFEGGTNESN